MYIDLRLLALIWIASVLLWVGLIELIKRFGNVSGINQRQIDLTYLMAVTCGPFFILFGILIIIFHQRIFGPSNEQDSDLPD
jgi:hypothetical protein